jgi:hypothetical protein
LVWAVPDDIEEVLESDIAFAFIESGLKSITAERSFEDMGPDKAVVEVIAATLRGHDSGDDLAALILALAVDSLCVPDVFGVRGIIAHASPPGSMKMQRPKGFPSPSVVLPLTQTWH